MVNDVVDKINQFNDKFINHFSKNIVIVKKTIKKYTNPHTKDIKKSNIIYVTIPTTEQITKDIINNKELTEEIVQKLLQERLINSRKEISVCVFIGNLKTFTDYDELVYQYPIRKVDLRERKEPEYKLYTRTKEQQEAMRGVFNICNNSKKSWLSVVEKCGSEFGLILKLVVKIN